MRVPRVLAFCDHFRPEVGGGAERVAREVYTRLAGRGVPITVVTTQGEGAGAWGDELEVVEVPSIDLSRWIGLQLSVTRGASEIVARVARRFRPTILHANSLQFDTSRVAARERSRSGVPLVVTAHIGGFEALAQPWRTLGAVHDRTVGRSVLRRADRVIAVSDAVARHLRGLGVASSRIRTVPNGVDHERFAPASRDTHAEVRVLFVGRLVGNKGADTAIAAVGRLRREGRRVRLDLVGDGPHRARLEARARDLGMNGAVRFHGTTDDVASFLGRADVLVRPTLTEGMSLSVLEAMASGVCVVASDVPGNAELITHGVNGLLAPVGDGRSLTAQLRRAVVDSEERARLAARAAEDSRRYSWDRCAEETLAVFEEAVSRRGAA